MFNNNTDRIIILNIFRKYMYPSKTNFYFVISMMCKIKHFLHYIVCLCNAYSDTLYRLLVRNLANYSINWRVFGVISPSRFIK